jgi:RimJ/RimL family protein N-acetyltransferase
MNQSNTQWQPATPLTLTTASYVLRSMVAADVDARFVAWLADPEVVETLNLPARARWPKEFASYIGRFDNRASFGLGIYEQQTGLIIGFYAIYCDLQHGLASTSHHR